MVTDRQVRRLMKQLRSGKTLQSAADKASMDEKTARKYVRLGKLPSEVKPEHNWRTREDPFQDVWEEVLEKLKANAGFESKTLFEDLQRRYPGKFSDGQLRTLQRRVKRWRALEGPAKEVFFEQVHEPGKMCQSDFTSMNALGITIQGQSFEHILYHFVLTYSNWETASICFSESFEALSEGLQYALWQLGGVPESHRTDRLTAAVNKPATPETFRQRYQGLLDHYGLHGLRIQAARPNENGDVEQRHHRLKRAVEQALLLRGSHDFASREEYAGFLQKLLQQLNAGRKERFRQELKVLKELPHKRLEACKRLSVRVTSGATIRILHNVYSVNSRLIREQVNVRLYVEHLEVWYAQRHIESIARLRGQKKHRIQYRHVIDWLVRKPGAFENYRYRDDLFPTHRFRMTYDKLREQHSPVNANKVYLGILHLAARESETGVDDALTHLLSHEETITVEAVKERVMSGSQLSPPTQSKVTPVNLAHYDVLLEAQEVHASW